jgi:TRAP-type C4-dicarboxylate transport system permease small subunit
VDSNAFMRAVSAFDRFLAEFAGWIIIVMMLTLSYDVIMRYAFGLPTTWAGELNRYFLVLVMFFGGPWALPAGGHVAVDIVTEALTERKRLRLEIVTSCMAVVYMAIFSMESMKYTWEAIAGKVVSTEYLALPMWPMRSFLVIGGVLLGFEFLFRAIRAAKKLKGLQR